MPRIMALKPTVLIVTGDHSTPASLARATVGIRCRRCWSPTPAGPTRCERSAKRSALRGGLGQFEAKYLMPLALAHAGRLGKYGA